MESVKNILLQILQEAEDRGLTLGKTQLIKFLYLTEVEAYRESGSRITNLDWIFYLYGPYAHEVESILEEPEFQRESSKTTTDKDFIQIRVAEPKKRYGTYVDTRLSLTIKKIIGQWGQKPLSELLDYVYFETEPMQNVRQRGQQLDFDTIHRRTEEDAVIPMKASKKANERIAAIRSEIGPFFEEMGRSSLDPITSDYVEALKEWEREENPHAALPENLTVKITNPSDSSAKEGH